MLQYDHSSLVSRGVPIIGLAKISATDMVIFNNIGIGTKQQEDRYLHSSNSLYINGLCIGFLRYPCGCLVSVAYCSLCNKQYAIRSHTKYTQFGLVFVAGKLITVFTNEAVIEYLCNKKKGYR